MEQARKAFIMLSAAITMSALGTEAALAGRAEPPKDKDQVGKNKPSKSKKQVERVRKARRRPADFDPDLAMPAGTAYDVMSIEDLQ